MVKRAVYTGLLNRRYFADRDPSVLSGYARQVAGRLVSLEPDIVFSPSTLPIAYLETKHPIVFWADATFAGMINFYPGFYNLCQQTIRDGHAAEESTLARCSLAIYASDWAAQTAIERYRVSPSKVRVVPFGANIDCDRSREDIRAIVNARPSNRCKLLFLGVEWVRKGGQVALDVATELNNAGLETELTVVGCEPPIGHQQPSFLKSLGFISKSTSEGIRQINRLLAESHFLIMPSRSECFGVVFCEANSFGVPCLSTQVGGIPTVIRNERNGHLFSIDAPISDYCTYILDLFSDYSRYISMAYSSFGEYESRLNWKVAGQTIKELFAEVLVSG